jgi:hypothetical protein
LNGSTDNITVIVCLLNKETHTYTQTQTMERPKTQEIETKKQKEMNEKEEVKQKGMTEKEEEKMKVTEMNIETKQTQPQEQTNIEPISVSPKDATTES